jgi:hypothetical protein
MLYTDDAMKALRHIEQSYFKAMATNRIKLSPKNLDKWPLSPKAKKYIMKVLISIGATKETHPVFLDQ